ncbi:MAG: hypothetical protein IJA33_04020 [Oscillospiraceae bacterium]|nr:hypothetical protein [Oscillospiraceae bacterium]
MKRLAALVLTLVMVLSLCPTTIWAEQQESKAGDTAVTGYAAAAPLTYDASEPVYTAGPAWCWNGVYYFTGLIDGVLCCHNLALSNGMVVVLSPGHTSQTVFLAVPRNNTLSVTGWEGDTNLITKQSGTWIGPDGVANDIYAFTANKMSGWSTVQYTVTRTIEGYPGADITQLVVDFAAVLTDDGDMLRGNWDVGVFTDLNGTVLSCDDTSVSQWYDTVFVAGGDVEEITVYLTIAPYAEFSLTPQDGGSTIDRNDMEAVGRWQDRNGNWKDVCKLTVQNPHNDSYTASYEGYRGWIEYFDPVTGDPVWDEDFFNMTFDFAPTLTGNVGGYGITNVMMADTLSAGGALSYSRAILGYGTGDNRGVVVFSGGKSQQTLYLATAAGQTLTVSGDVPPVSFERVGTYLYNNSVLAKVYALTAANSADVLSYRVSRDWKYINNNGTADDYSDDYISNGHEEFPVAFDFTEAPSGPVSITAHPEDQTADDGAVNFTVSAAGTGLQYQWESKAATGKIWTAIDGANTNRLSVLVTAGNNGKQYRCVVTDAYGDKAVSDPAALFVIFPGGHIYDNNVNGTCNHCGIKRETVEARQVGNMFRMYNPNTGEHFYTGSEKEKGDLVAAGWQYEGIAFTFPENTGAPVYRLFQPSTGEHLYTMDEAEVEALMANGWNYENIAFNSAYDTEAVQHRLHNPNATVGAYHFTFSEEEMQNLINAGWEDQGIGWYSCWK